MIDWKGEKFNPIGSRFEAGPEMIGFGPLLKKALEGDPHVSHFYREGYSDKAFEIILKKVIELKGRKVYENISSSSEDHLYLWDDACIEICLTKSKMTRINAISYNESIIAICKEVAELFTAPVKKGYVFAITKGQSGLQLTRIGYAGSPIERGNYTEEVCRDYDYIIEDLQSKDPTGRVIILDGVAGTGKTFITRSILMDVSKAMFVIVPPNMVSSIGGPELLPLLLRTKEDYGKRGPIVFILEDADQCLAPRESDNISSISAILNLGDGILGTLFDVRIIATTNAKVKDIDRAILRDMRLSKRISVQPLLYDHANKIYKRIFKDDTKELPRPTIERDAKSSGFGMSNSNETKKSTFTLAEIYKLARDTGWKPVKSEETDTSGNSLTPPEYVVDIEDENDLFGKEYMG